MQVKELVERLGGGYAKALHISLVAGREREIFKWFLASFLYGARISESLANRTYLEFERHAVLTPGRRAGSAMSESTGHRRPSGRDIRRC